MANPGAPSIDVPLLLVNFKTYPQTRREAALRLAKSAGRVAREVGATIAVAPGPLDLPAVAKGSAVPVFAQHVDAWPSGQHTGAVTPDFVRELGAVGTLLNHSEKRLHTQTLANARALCAKVGLISVICAGTVAQSRKVAALAPEFVAIEPPDLIGGEVSVSSARPSVISRSVEAVHAVAPRTRVLCGAGVKKREDVARALELGADGVLVASGVTLAPDPAAALRDLAKGLT